MSDETGYNGWTNRETWCVSLWLDNEQGTYFAVRERAVDHMEDENPWQLAETIRSYVEDLAEMTCPGCTEGASFVTDLFGSALAHVNYIEIAENLLTDARDSVEA